MCIKGIMRHLTLNSGIINKLQTLLSKWRNILGIIHSGREITGKVFCHYTFIIHASASNQHIVFQIIWIALNLHTFIISLSLEMLAKQKKGIELNNTNVRIKFISQHI